MRIRLFPVLLMPLAMVAAAFPASAQNTIPGLENFTLERTRPQPTPSPTPFPSPVPTVTPTPVPVQPRPSPTPTAADTPRPTPTARPTARPTQQPRPTTPAADQPPAPAPVPTELAPAPTDTPVATPTETPPSVEPSPSPEAIAPAEEPTNWMPWAALAAALVAGLGAFAWWRRRSADSGFEDDDTILITGGEDAHAPVETPPADQAAEPPAVAPVDQPSLPSVAPQPAPPAPARPGGLVTSSLKPGGVVTTGGLVTSALKPELRISLTPFRGGVDSLRATLEFQLNLVNAGSGAARGVVVECWLTSAGNQTHADLATLFARPPGEPMMPPFDLPASAAIDLDGVATAPREMLAMITAGERRMFVPVLATRVLIADGRGGQRAVTAAFLVGIERDGQARLTPLPLDRGSRMNDRLAARPYEG